jgi:hypothetical protein
MFLLNAAATILWLMRVLRLIKSEFCSVTAHTGTKRVSSQQPFRSKKEKDGVREGPRPPSDVRRSRPSCCSSSAMTSRETTSPRMHVVWSVHVHVKVGSRRTVWQNMRAAPMCNSHCWHPDGVLRSAADSSNLHRVHFDAADKTYTLQHPFAYPVRISNNSPRTSSLERRKSERKIQRKSAK